MANIKFNAAEVMKNMAGIQFPASKEQVIEAARQNGASQEICDLLEEKLPQEEFRSTAEVLDYLSDDDSAGGGEDAY